MQWYAEEEDLDSRVGRENIVSTPEIWSFVRTLFVLISMQSILVLPSLGNCIIQQRILEYCVLLTREMRNEAKLFFQTFGGDPATNFEPATIYF